MPSNDVREMLQRQAEASALLWVKPIPFRRLHTLNAGTALCRGRRGHGSKLGRQLLSVTAMLHGALLISEGRQGPLALAARLLAAVSFLADPSPDGNSRGHLLRCPNAPYHGFRHHQLD